MKESSDSSDGKAVSHSEVSRIAVKVPPFWRENPAIWFSRLESQFITSGIVQDSTKYHIVVASVETEILSQVSDIITSPPNDDMYKKLKERLINMFSDSEERRLKKLLQDVELGDKRPSMLLRQMRDLAGNRVGDELLRSLWLQRLPTQMQAILTTSSDDLMEKVDGFIFHNFIGGSNHHTYFTCYSTHETRTLSARTDSQTETKGVTIISAAPWLGLPQSIPPVTEG
ncbi:hypothetical protein AVEN_6293-1 [Araneus ventricosus]|uniref:DUF7041 domain-containing protein n=1 Tax=Araneus ventricosus TaxID=182803 RepID=A0A4Y2LTU6_ARAVE|nr:hypothetical protein AVEN_6293-1 [Araneus ventricosus]